MPFFLCANKKIGLMVLLAYLKFAGVSYFLLAWFGDQK